MFAGYLMYQHKKWRFLFLLVGLILVLDQGTKLYVHHTFLLHESRPVVADFFHLTYVRNSGAAFGLLARQNATFLRLFFPAVTLCAVVILLLYFQHTPRQRVLTLSGICLIIGGALGNGIDRLWLGQVIDFLDFFWQTYHWPAFNVADSAICVGVGCLLLDAFLHPAPSPVVANADHGTR
jgi:signal peptidase II